MSRHRTIYFVCTGNTCRSPMAEALFRVALSRENLTESFSVSSFGLATASGAPASSHALSVLAEQGVDLSKHRSRRFADITLDPHGFFVAMTPAHLHALKTLPARSFCIGEFFPKKTLLREVPDPFGGTPDDYKTARDAITSAFPQLICFLKTLV